MLELRKMHRFNVGTTASEETARQLSTSPHLCALFLYIRALQNGLGPVTEANIDAQAMSEFEFRIANDKYVEFFTETEIAELIERRVQRSLTYQIGGGADNQVVNMTYPIPLGPWASPVKGLFDFGIDSRFGLRNPSRGNVEFRLAWPADGNNIDTRSIELIGLYETQPASDYQGMLSTVERVITPTAVGKRRAIEISYPDMIGIWDYLLFQTTERSAGITTDDRTFETIAEFYENRIAGLLGDMDPEVFGAVFAQEGGNAATEDDEFLYVPRYERKDSRFLFPRSNTFALEVDFGVADAARMHVGVIRRP